MPPNAGSSQRERKLGWLDATMAQARHARVTLAHVIGEPGSGATFMDELEALDTDAWQLVRSEIIDPSDKAPKGFERIDAALTTLLEQVRGARENLRCFDEPTSARDAYELYEEEVAFDCEFEDALKVLQRAVHDVGGELEKAAEAEEACDAAA